MLSTFESLPNEIIMIIVKYSGDVFSILRTYLGLHERFNQILLDKRLHLLTDFLHINLCHGNFDYYYDSHVFRGVTEELFSMKHSITDQQLRQCFQSKYRKCFNDEQLLEANNELKEIFNKLLSKPLSKGDIKRVESLIFLRGARLECPDNHVSDDLNLAKAFNKLFFAHIDNTRFISRARLNMNCYRVIIDLALFIFQYAKQIVTENDWCELTVWEILAELVHSNMSCVEDGLFVQTSQSELLKILLNERIIRASIYDELLCNIIERTMKNLIKKTRLDLILLICEHHNCVQNIFENPEKNRIFVDQMTGDRSG
ncbi:hypothetical protein I4U23_022812 [Adineta vaga]|nr:hypothetical protein I4U23_022812 [Adineta vaga]